MNTANNMHRYLIGYALRGLAILSSFASCLAAENNLTLQTTLVDASQIQINVSKQAPDVVCRVDTSSNLSYWTFLFSTNSPAGSFNFTDRLDPSTIARFYRAAESGEIVGQVASVG